MGVWVRPAVAVAALALILGPSATAQVPDPFARALARQLASAETVLSADGYSRAAGPFAGGLGQRENRRFTLSLRAGLDYRIVGVCDRRCGALALRLFDPNDALIARDIGANSAPAMHVRPAATGPHVVEVVMPRCAAAQCWYAVNVYSR